MNELEFGFRVRQVLNEGADRISYKAGLRLEKARRRAVAQARGAAPARPAPLAVPALQLATDTGPVDAPARGGLWSWLRGAGLLAPLLALAAGFVGIYEWHHQRLVEELAYVDFAVLLDEAPLDAYADQGFGRLLQQRAAGLTAQDVVLPAAEAAADAPPDPMPAGL